LMSIATWSLTGVAAGFLLLRLCIRQNQGKLWLDDVVLGISWVGPSVSDQVFNDLCHAVTALVASHRRPTYYKPGVWKALPRQ
jgi:hypothetical protein